MFARTVDNRLWLFVVPLAVAAVWGFVAHGSPSRSAAPALGRPEKLPGTLYCRSWPGGDHRLWQIGADGTRPRLLPDGVSGEPSRHLHAGRRWFIDVRPVPGETCPDGGARHELFAVRDDGRTVRLTRMPDGEPMAGSARWLPHAQDSLIGWIGRRWDTGGRVAEGGVYTMEIGFDDQGNAAGSDKIAAHLAVSRPLRSAPGPDAWSRAAVPDVDSFDWAPDGSSLALTSLRGELLMVRRSTGETRQLTARPASDPSWSPDGSMLAFKIRKAFGGIAVLSVIDSRAEVLVGDARCEPFVVAAPFWSPSGDSVVFGYVDARQNAPELPAQMDVMLAALNTGRCANLTADVSDPLVPVAWR